MDPLHVPLAAATVLLVPAGLSKLVRPRVAHRALRAVGVPARPTSVRLLGAAEVAAAASTIAWGGRVAVATAVAYVASCAFVLVALARRVPLDSCGCFGARDGPPTQTHAAVTAAAAAVAAVSAAEDLESIRSVLAGGGGDSALVVAGGLALATLAYLVLTGRLRAARPR